MQTFRGARRGPLLVALLAALSSAAGAQDFSAERRGMAASVGGGIGNGGVSCVPRCQGDRNSGPSLLLRGTANVGPQFAVAAEINFFRKDVPTAAGDGRWQFTWVALTALWYPRSEEDVFIKVGVGVGGVKAHATFPTVGALPLKSNNLGLVVGIGRDVRLTDSFAVTAYADYLGMARATAYIANSDSGARISADLVNVGLALTIF